MISLPQFTETIPEIILVSASHFDKLVSIYIDDTSEITLAVCSFPVHLLGVLFQNSDGCIIRWNGRIFYMLLFLVQLQRNGVCFTKLYSAVTMSCSQAAQQWYIAVGIVVKAFD